MNTSSTRQTESEPLAVERASDAVEAAPHPWRGIALTIAGHDPSSGAGITADLMTFAAHDLFGTSCITALTVQSTSAVREVRALPPDLISASLRCLEEDLPPAGIKIGMLGSAGAVYAVSEYLRQVRGSRTVFVVLDPVLRSSSNVPLLDEDAFVALRETLLPVCDAVTPNRAELFRLLDREREGTAELATMARALQTKVGGGEVVVTGGDEDRPDDLVLGPLGALTWLCGRRVDTRATHGTGCAFSSALLSCRLQGLDLEQASRAAKTYVEEGLRRAPMLGKGSGPLHLLWPKDKK